jgi:hypothetical protein
MNMYIHIRHIKATLHSMAGELLPNPMDFTRPERVQTSVLGWFNFRFHAIKLTHSSLNRAVGFVRLSRRSAGEASNGANSKWKTKQSKLTKLVHENIHKNVMNYISSR